MKAKVTITRSGPIVPCARREQGCAGEVALARMLGKHAVSGDEMMAICPKCLTPRMVGRATALRLKEVQVPAHIRRQVAEAVKVAQARRMLDVRARFERENGVQPI